MSKETKNIVIRDEMKKHASPVVLFFRGSLCEMSRREFDGIASFSTKSGWSLQTIEFGAAAETRQVDQLRTASDLKRLLQFWRPSGCIVECSGNTPQFDASAFDGTPTVFLDCTPSFADTGVPCVLSDDAAIASLAAKELLSMGFQDYACAPFREGTEWSRVRERSFAEIIRMNGKRFHAYPDSGKPHSAKCLRGYDADAKFEGWCASLPKPCGIFAVNDVVAQRVVASCVRSGIEIPHEVAVVGVDDEIPICENSPVSITSIRTDNERSGYLAAELLSRCMHGECLGRVCRFEPSRIVRRQSTFKLRMNDAAIVKALEHIRKHACERLTVMDVVEVMSCSRRLADMKFRAIVGHSILDEIHSVRISKVKELLHNPTQMMSAVPDICGYASMEDLCRVFRRREGMTMREYRRTAVDA